MSNPALFRPTRTAKHRFTVEWTRSGQTRPYGPTERVCRITAIDPNFTTADMLDAINNTKLPKEIWEKNIHNMGLYFQGYYTLTRIDDKTFEYYGYEPYDD